MKHFLASAFLLSMVVVSLGASAQYPGGSGYQPPETIYKVDWTERLAPNLGLKAHDHNLLGDNIDLSSGRLSFEQVDVSIPGNSDLPVEIRRRRNPSQSFHNEFEDWQLVVPSISTRINNTEFNSGNRWGKKRCSEALVNAIPSSNYAKVYFHSDAAPIPAYQYNDGVNLDVPGRGSGQLLDKTVSAGWPSAAKKVTRDGWYFTCIANIDGNGTEGFYGYAPNGDRYTFNVIRSRYMISPAEYWYIQYASPKPMVWYHNEWGTYDVLAASEVRDVHGNWVKYLYNSSGQLTRIYSNDDRRIDIAYSSGGKISSVTAHPGTSDQRTWQYSYGTKPVTRYKTPSEAMGYAGTYTTYYTVLTRVELPDGRSWNFDLAGLFASAVPGTSYNAFDTSMPQNRGGLVVCRQQDQTVSITHPDGITGTFWLTEQARFMPRAANSQYGPPCPNSNWGKGPNTQVDVMAVVKKTLSAPGVPTAQWTYDYSSTVGGSSPGIPTTVTLPDNTVQVHHYSIPYDYSTQLKEEIFASASSTTPLQTTEYTYVLESAAGSSFVQGNLSDVTQPARQTEVKITRGADWYRTRLTYNTDRSASTYSWGSPIKVEKWSSLGGGTRTTDITYLKDADDWILSLVDIVKKNGKTFDDYDYDTKGRLVTHKRFGATTATLGYYTSGTQAGQLNWYKDALGRNTSFSNYYRGVPQTITRADNTAFTRALNHDGWVTRETNWRGVVTDYDYDLAGRLTRIIKPSAWQDVLVDYDYDGENLIQTVSHGDLQTTTRYDAMLRPVQVLKQTLAGGGDDIYIETDYDAMGRNAFQSLPSQSAGSSIGIATSYDALGRVTQRRETASGGGTTRYAYLSGNRTQITDPMGNVITQTQSGFGDPEDGQLLKEQKPEGITATYSYDIYGNLLTLSQAKSSGSHTSRFVYDGRLRLCRKSIPETGDTLYAYNNADEMTAYAEGQFAGTVCATPPSASAVNLVYDTLGRLKTTDYPSGTADIARTYDGNGNLLSVNRGGANWSYTYNDIDLIELERLSIDGRTYDISYQYDSGENLIQQSFPSGRGYTFTNDGHGRLKGIRDGSTYLINNADYHPNGKLKYLQRGNGGVYEQHLNARQLPSYIGGNWGTSLSLTYNAKGQLTNVNSPNNNYDRGYTYDGAGRLKTATGPWGAGSFSYDPLGNLTQKKLGSRIVDVEYNSLNRVYRAKDTAGGNTWRTYAYDARGNVTNNGSHGFGYDYANQPTSLSGTGAGTFVYDGNLKRVKQVTSGETIYSVYSQAGSLVSRINASTGKSTDYLNVAGQTFARVTNGVASYPLNDHLGTAYMVADRNGGISSANTFNYTPFGETLGSGPGAKNEQGFTGHIEDASGLVYMQARYYDPAIGRFLSADPVGYQDQLNLYAYVHNDPLNLSDPSGKVATALEFAAGVGAFACSRSPGCVTAVGSGIAVIVGGVTGYFSESESDESSEPESEPHAEPGTKESEYGCVYECDGVSEGQETESGKPYIGTADDKERRSKRARDGRNRENAETIGKYKKGDRTGRQNAEQQAINDRGGKRGLDNKRDEVAERKWRDRGIRPPEDPVRGR